MQFKQWELIYGKYSSFLQTYVNAAGIKRRENLLKSSLTACCKVISLQSNRNSSHLSVVDLFKFLTSNQHLSLRAKMLRAANLTQTQNARSHLHVSTNLRAANFT